MVIFNGNLRLEKLGGEQMYGHMDAAQKSDKKQPIRYYFVCGGGGRAEECGWGWTRNLFNLPMDFISFSNSKEPETSDQSNQNDKKLTFFHLLLEFPTDL